MRDGCDVEHEIDWRPSARKDLDAIYDWIADLSDPLTALAYIEKIEAFVAKLSYFPNRGTPRAELTAGLRSVTFERRAIVSYLVQDRTVRIVRVLHTARDISSIFQDQ